MARRVVFRMSSGTLIFMVVYFCTSVSLAMETKVSVDCQSDPQNMIVQVETDIPFLGKVYVTQMHDDPGCSIKGKGRTTTMIKIPYKGCNTTEKTAGLFLTRITVQQHRLIVSAGDGNYEVGCKMFRGDIKVGSSSGMAVTKQPIDAIQVSTSSVAPPEVLLRIYDFENEVFLDTVRLGQVVELEITIRDGNMYQGRVSDCDAKNGNGQSYPIIRNYCPVDLTISDRVYVDDQSKTTGDYYLYIPFRVFRFLDGARVSFSCNVIICQGDCPSADCGEFMGMSYGRKKRELESRASHTLTVSNQVTVVDEARNMPSTNENENDPGTKDETRSRKTSVHEAWPSAAMRNRNSAWTVGTIAISAMLVISVAANVFLILARRRISTQRLKNQQKYGRCGDSGHRFFDETHLKPVMMGPRRHQAHIIYYPAKESKTWTHSS